MATKSSSTPTTTVKPRIPYRAAPTATQPVPKNPMDWLRPTYVMPTTIAVVPSTKKTTSAPSSKPAVPVTVVPFTSKQTPSVTDARTAMQYGGVDPAKLEASINVLHRARNEIILFCDNVQHAYRETELVSPHPRLKNVAEGLLIEARDMQSRLEVLLSGESVQTTRIIAARFGKADADLFGKVFDASGNVLEVSELNRLSMSLDIPNGVVASEYALSVVNEIGGQKLAVAIDKLDEQSRFESGKRQEDSDALKQQLITLVLLAQTHPRSSASTELNLFFCAVSRDGLLEFSKPELLRSTNPQGKGPFLSDATLAAVSNRVLPDSQTLYPLIGDASVVRLNLLNELKLRGKTAISQLALLPSEVNTSKSETPPVLRMLTNPNDEGPLKNEIELSSAKVLDLFFSSHFAGSKAESEMAANVLELTIADRSIAGKASKEAKRSLSRGFGLLLQDDGFRKQTFDRSIGMGGDVSLRELLLPGAAVESDELRKFYGELSTDKQAHSLLVAGMVAAIGTEVANATDAYGNIDLAAIHVDAPNAFGNLARGVAEKANGEAARKQVCSRRAFKVSKQLQVSVRSQAPARNRSDWRLRARDRYWAS
jgi:hypothetical protein